MNGRGVFKSVKISSNFIWSYTFNAVLFSHIRCPIVLKASCIPVLLINICLLPQISYQKPTVVSQTTTTQQTSILGVVNLYIGAIGQ